MTLIIIENNEITNLITFYRVSNLKSKICSLDFKTVKKAFINMLNNGDNVVTIYSTQENKQIRIELNEA